MMDRRTVITLRKSLGFLLCSFKEELCFALLCPDKTQENDPKHRMR